MLRVVFYTHTAYLAPALQLLEHLSRVAEVHAFVELSPGAWHLDLFDVAPTDLAPGLMPATPLLRAAFPPSMWTSWTGAASLQFVVHKEVRSLHPTSWRISRLAARHIANLQPDVVHFDDESLRMALALPWLPRVPVVISVHDPEPHSGERDWRSELARRVMFTRVARYIVHSRALAAPFGRRYGIHPDQVATIPLGPYTIARAWAPPVAEDDGPMVLFFGRVSPYKGLETLYGAAQQVAEQVPGVRIVVAGRPVRGYRPPSPPVLPNNARVDVIDSYVPNHLMAALFHSASVVACPYVDATQSGVVLSAYAFGKPVVASRVGGLPEYIQDRMTGLLVPPGDRHALAEALVELLTDAPLRARLAASIAGLCETTLSWRSIADQTLEVYRRASHSVHTGA